jgi:Ca2+-transporting ATPase
MLGYLLATNAGEALTMIGALLLFDNNILTPIQILWINLVTDSLLVIPLGLEPPEQQILRRKPEHKDASILPSNMVIRMVIIAITMTTITLGTYFVSNLVLRSPEQANTLAFTALVVMQWSGAIAARGTFESVWQRLKVRNPGLLYALFVAILLQLAAIFGPLMSIVDTVSVPVIALVAVALVAFFIPLIVIEFYKTLQSQD